MTQPRVIIVAGPNGAGKSTTSTAMLSSAFPLINYINPDLIARGLAPLDPSSVSFAAGRIVHNRIRELMNQRENFAFETTLSGRAYATLLPQLAALGYRIDLVFLWLESADLAVQRVAGRVREGGHDIPEADIRRRYEAGVRNFFGIYRELVHGWRFYDNSALFEPVIVAEFSSSLKVHCTPIWQSLLDRYSL